MKYITIILIYSILVFCGYLFVPESVQYHKGGLLILLPLGVAIILIPALVSFIYKLRGQHAPELKRIFMSLVIGALSGYIPADYYRIYRNEQEFKSAALSATGRISFRWREDAKNYNGWKFQCEFYSEPDGRKYLTFPQDDREDKYRIGDTLRILYLKRNPEISKIPALENSE
jgi:hypothetical protein